MAKRKIGKKSTAFYQVYAERTREIRHTPCGVLDDLTLAVEHSDRIRGFSPRLGWSHY